MTLTLARVLESRDDLYLANWMFRKGSVRQCSAFAGGEIVLFFASGLRTETCFTVSTRGTEWISGTAHCTVFSTQSIQVYRNVVTMDFTVVAPPL